MGLENYSKVSCKSLLAALVSLLTYWYQWAREGKADKGHPSLQWHSTEFQVFIFQFIYARFPLFEG